MSQAACGAQVVQDWRAEISCRIDQLGGSFSVFLFLGNVPTNPSDWLTDRAFVGTFDIYAPDSSPYHSGPASSELVLDGFVLLNRAIWRLTKRPSLDDSIVVPILTQSLNWGVQKVIASYIYHLFI
jgi:tyrosinase